MAKRFVGFLKNLRGETNLKNGETFANNTKAELMAQIEQLKTKMPSIREGIDAVKGVPGRIPDDLLKNKVRDVITRYEKFTGVDEIMVLQKTVVEAQDKFIAAQDKRREAGTKLLNMQWRLKEIHEEMQNTPKGDQKYLKLVTDEHKTIVEEQHLRKEFGAIEREEREHFGTMSAAVKLSHERERAHADRNKYWYIVASLIGTGFGVLGSTLNNRIKMAEFREMLTEQMERSNNVLMTVGQGGRTTGVPGSSQSQQYGVDLTKQAQQLRDVEMRVAAIASNQGTILDHMRKTEKTVNIQLEDIKCLIIASTATSAKSDKKLNDAIKRASATSQSTSDSSHDLMTKIGENEEYLKMTFFVGVVLLVIYGIIGKLS